MREGPALSSIAVSIIKFLCRPTTGLAWMKVKLKMVSDERRGCPP